MALLERQREEETRQRAELAKLQERLLHHVTSRYTPLHPVTSRYIPLHPVTSRYIRQGAAEAARVTVVTIATIIAAAVLADTS